MTNTTHAAKNNASRCAGCGKPVLPGHDYYTVDRVSGSDGRKRKSWGKMHPSCFSRMTPKPQDPLDVLDQITRGASAA